MFKDTLYNVDIRSKRERKKDKKMENLNYDLVSDCCGAGCAFETGEGKDRIGICMDCKEWCGVVEDIPEDEDMLKALEEHNSMTMEEYESLPDYIPGLDDGEWESDEDCCGEEDFA